MRKLVLVLFLFPMIGWAQLDFESYKGKLDFVRLPEIESLGPLTLTSTDNFSKKYSNKLPSFKLSKENYRTPVNMYEAMTATSEYVKSDLKISLDPREYGIYGNSSYSADGSTKVKNIAYKDASNGFFYHGTCPPYGICPRCAPYRVGRSYY